MAVGLTAPDKLELVDGIKIATTNAGIRYQDRDDMVLMTISEGSNVAAVFTQNKFCAAPVIGAKRHLLTHKPRALLINAGNANAGTGEIGFENMQFSCETVAQKLSLEPEQILPFSTGVIGEQLPMDNILSGISDLTSNLQEDNWFAASSAIMTTDTIAKGASKQIDIGGNTITITGICKGSGMICPDMATLLSYVATDAKVDQSSLQKILESATDKSFNRITVDSDTSTNDSLVLIATGKSDVRVDENTDKFVSALNELMQTLATAIIRDAEGATKFVNIEVFNGLTEKDCKEIAYSVAHSPLVKTALFASDPNWGRILAAIGKAKVDHLDIDKVNIKINDQSIIESGQPAKSYSEEIGQSVFAQDEITITIDLCAGDAAYNVWTSDLSHEYVSVNADYRS